MNDALGELLAARRVSAVLPLVKGRLLDLGCGSNRLVRDYANGVGVDVHPWPGADVIVSDASILQWESQSFDTITIIAALNHIPNREAVLRECRRVLRPGGQVVVTMIPPRTSRLWHWLRLPWDADQRERGMKPGEVYGFTASELVALFQRCGFRLKLQRRFMLGVNGVFVFEPVDAPAVASQRVNDSAGRLSAAH